MAPTYVLAPNFTYRPNTLICLGDIVRDPDDPTKPLSSVPASELRPTTSQVSYDYELSSQSTQSLHGNIWATFLKKASAKVGGGTSDELLARYAIRQLETVYFTKQPTDDEAAARVRASKKVQAAVKAGLVGKRPVFMVTGLKIARGFRLSSSASASKSATAELPAAVSVAPGVGVGASVDASRKTKQEQSYRTEQDIVFAYQLHVIKHKGWAQRDVDISVHRPRAAFLNDDKNEGGQDSVEVEELTESNLRDFDEELPVEAISAKDGDEDCICIVFGDE